MEKIVIALLAVALAQQPGEYQVKAVYMLNFGKFVEWPVSTPASQGDTFPVCVMGTDPFGAVLDKTLQGERIAGKNIVTRSIAKAKDAADCRILFISSSESSRIKEILAALQKTTVLTVSDMRRFVQDGGMIQFVMEGTRVRFEINRARADEANLVLSSELLKVAAAVR